jgi:hexulose-6-phosphate isomerase
MIKTISYWSMKRGLENTHPIDQALNEARDAGFEALELAVGTEGVLTPETTQAECEAIRKTIDGSGVKVETLASGMTWAVNPTSDDAQVRERSIALHAGALQRAAWLGCKAMLFVPGVVKSPISPDVIRYDRAVERATEAVNRLAEVAENVGVDLCVENVWNGLFYSPLEFREFIDSFASERVAIYLDATNMLGYHQHPPFWIELLGNRIRRVHVKDFQESVGSLEGFCDLLEGDMPWAETIRALREIGYDDTIVAEMIPWSEGLLDRTSRAMDKILAM